MFSRNLSQSTRSASTLDKTVKNVPNASNRKVGKISAQATFARASSQRAIKKYANTLRWLGGGDRMGR